MGQLPPILIVEDNDDDMFILKRVIHKCRVENKVISFQDPRAAIGFMDAAIRAGDRLLLPLIIFSDFEMPGLSGLEIVKWVRSRVELKATLVVIISGSVDDNVQHRSLEAGAAAFIAKYATEKALLPLLGSAGITFSPAAHT